MIKVGIEKSNIKEETEIVLRKDEIIPKNPDLVKAEQLEAALNDLTKDLERKKMKMESRETTLKMKDKKIEDQQIQIESFLADSLQIKGSEVQSEKEKQITEKLFKYFGVKTTGTIAMDLIDARSEIQRLNAMLEKQKVKLVNKKC